MAMRISKSIVALTAILSAAIAYAVPSVQIVDDAYGAPMSVDTNGAITQVMVNENGNALSVDLITRALMTVDYAHHEIHAGSTFRVQHNDNAIPATGSGGELVIAFTVPDQAKQPHMIWDFVHEGDMTMKLLEGVTLTTNGTDVACKNSNRNSSTTSVLQGNGTGSLASGYVTVGENSADSIHSGGTVISLQRNYAARNTAGEGSRRAEIILKPGLAYAFVLDNNETTTQGGQIRLEWYEHTPKTD